MDLYTSVSYQNSKSLTLSYSSSFGISSRLFAPEIRNQIYAVYGLVRIADEIVDTYKGSDAGDLLSALENDTYTAMSRGYSTNPIVHAFADTAIKFNINEKLIQPFFESMHMDLTPQQYDELLYENYIYGSAEVIGLMCLRIFSQGDNELYQELQYGARRLGAGFQKINFLRDMASDYKELGRLYFPETDFSSFSEHDKQKIIDDIDKDFQVADSAITYLPISSRRAVRLSFLYYSDLLEKIASTPVDILKTNRIRIDTSRKIMLLGKTYVSGIRN